MAAKFSTRTPSAMADKKNQPIDKWTGTEERERSGLLRQFCKLESGLGNSEAFRVGWELVFGKKEKDNGNN